MSRFARRILQAVGLATLVILAFLGLALTSAAWALSKSVRALDFELLGTIALFGALTGWLLARSRLRGRTALPLALAIAVATILLRVGQLGGGFWEVIAALAQVRWDARLQQVDAQPVFDALALLITGAAALWTRTQSWAGALAAGESVFDPVATALVWSLGLWLVAAWAAWMLRRRGRPVVAFAPLLLLLALVLAYTGGDAWTMIVLIGALLALMVIVSHRVRRQRWERAEIPYAQDLGVDLAIIAVPAIVCVLIAALALSPFSPREIARWVQAQGEPVQTTSNLFSNSLGLVPAPRPTTAFDPLRAPGLPRSHLIGAAPELLRTPALTIETDELPQESPVYWRSSTYDVYTGRGWLTSNLQTNGYRANARVPVQDAAPYRTLHQTIHAQNGAPLVYAAGDVVSVDHDFQIAARTNQDVFAAQVPSDAYRVESRVAAVDAAALREAGEQYPEWIRSRYLALPQDVPPRVLALARDLTATAPTPYDRARAIETYLRTIPYTLDLPAPPTDRDVVDYFLFDLRRGYCDYYATAMAVLARAAGLPARIAVGYATGAYDPTVRAYRVTEAEAHSWAQIYFPDYGWVDFEPTRGREASAYESGRAAPSMPPRGEASPGVSPARGAMQNARFILPGALLLLGVFVLLVAFADQWRLRRMSPAVAVNELYGRMVRAARRLGLPVTPSQTPHQVSALLDAYFAAPPVAARRAALWQPVRETIPLIAESFVQTTYGARTPDAVETASLARRWQRVRGRVWLAIALNVIAEVTRRAHSVVRMQWNRELVRDADDASG